jgi:O-antigen/teichoic acid export membrane protein
MTLTARLKALVPSALPKSSIARSISVLAGGTALGQVLLILVSPVLTRLYTTADFGVLAIYMALLSLFGVVASLRYELAIPLPEHDEDAANLVALCFVLVGLVTATSALVVYFVGQDIASLLGAPAIAPYLWLLPVGIFLTGIDGCLRHLAIRQKAFKIVATTTVKRAIANIFIQLAGFKLGSISLLLGHASGQGVGIGSLVKLHFDSHKKKWVSIAGIKSQAIRYKKFPLYSIWEGLLNTAGAQLPPLLFAAMFSPVAAGLYSLANRVLSLPISLIGSAVAQVFLSEAPRATLEGGLGPLIAKFHAKLTYVGLPPALLLFMVGPELFGKIFGSEWAEAGAFARWMTPWIYLVFVASPFSTVPSVMGRQKQGMLFQIILLGARVAAIIIGAKSGNLLTTVILYSISSAICWAGFLVWIKSATKIPPRDILTPLGSSALVATMCSLPLIIEKLLPQTSEATWWACLALSVLMIAIRILQLIRRESRRGI